MTEERQVGKASESTAAYGVEPRSVWISRDPRDNGLRVTVLQVENGFVRYKRLNTRTVRTENFLKLYRPTVTP